jgi:hypothetical protein
MSSASMGDCGGGGGAGIRNLLCEFGDEGGGSFSFLKFI